MLKQEEFMPRRPLTTPVLFLVFNRPDTTKRVFESIRECKPPKLFVAADGPRPDKLQEKEKCDEVRIAATSVDWDCEVTTLFREENLGCKKAVSSAVDWFFEQVGEGIILEDDCVPHQSFFWFCQELLSKYRNDERIMLISGDNFQFGKKRTGYSYYFSRFSHVWGWASWRRAWKLYDVDMSLWPKIRDDGWLNDILDEEQQVRYWAEMFENVHQGRIDTWDYQWTFACWINNGLSILPAVNLVQNIGFDDNATHTKVKNEFCELPADIMEFPLKEPPFVIRDKQADNFTANRQFYVRCSFYSRIFNKIRKLGRA